MTNPVGAPGAISAAVAHQPRHPVSDSDLAKLMQRLDYEFAESALLAQALAHRSWCAENAGYRSNERLEFLGDAVLGLVVTEYLHGAAPNADEGQMSRIRAEVVCSAALADMAREVDLGSVILLGKGEATSGGRTRSSILADAMEAVFGATYLDGGMDNAVRVIRKLVDPRLENAGMADPKSRLHMLVASAPERSVHFQIQESGPEHDKTYSAVVILDGERAGQGEGRSKKEAEQAAARETWRLIEADSGAVPQGEERIHG